MPTHWWDPLLAFLNRPILPLGAAGVSLGVLIQFVLLVALLFLFASRAERILVRRILTRTKLDASGRQAVGSVFHYAALLAGFLIILQAVGIDITALSVVVGGLGIGLGFGLQNIATNLISGLIVLLERPIKIGDRIEVAGTQGQVIEIRARSTTVLTNDNIAIIIPNSRFITEEVINWSYNDAKVRFCVPVRVGYGSDARAVERMLLEVARSNTDVLAEPPPTVRFREFGDSALNFELLVWTASLVQRRGKLFSDLNFAILEKLRANGVEIPFPQRDVHIRNS